MLKKLIKYLFIICLSWAYGCYADNVTHSKPFSQRKEVIKFIHEMHAKHGLDKTHLASYFKHYKTDQKVLSLMSRQFEALPWYRYQSLIVTDDRVKKGLAFLKKNKAILKKVEMKYGVPPEVIVAIIGIESNYGELKGNFPVLQTLATLAFDYPRRASFFKEELEHFLLLSKEEGFDPTTLKGSYAGAIGMGQFMPSSYRRYGVDFLNVGKKDLFFNDSDVIASVANYFKVNGWRTGEEVAEKAVVKGHSHKKLLSITDLKPKISLIELSKKYQVNCHKKKLKNMSQLARFASLKKSENSEEHWLLLHNFYVITRYNRSIHYAMAVHQLSQRIHALRQG